jgi:hypothetical protein
MAILSRIPSRCWWALAAAAASAGCSSSVVVQATFPSPLVEPLPVRVGLIFDEELQNYIHVEDIPEQSVWTIDLGDANIAMFEPLFKRMFMEARPVEAVPLTATDGALHGVLRPSLQKFEFDVPIGERDEFVEVWMQYQLTLYAPNGDTVIEWPVSGYGKAELGRNREEAVRRAAVVAMREVGATISTKFAEQPQVEYWIDQATSSATVAAGHAADVDEPTADVDPIINN